MFHYIHTFIMFKHVNFGKYIWIHTSKIKKKHGHFKMSSRELFTRLFFSFFIPECYVMLCILYLKSIHKIVYNKKLINIDWLMLHSLQETKCDASLLLLLLQPTQTKFKQQQPQQQQKTTQFQYENSTKASRLHFSDLQ